MRKEKLKILVVEDDIVTRQVITKMLLSYGNCDIAVNGDEAIKSYRFSLEEKIPYDLICLDIVMPEVDGHQALREIREMEETYGVPDNKAVNIIMVTALNDPKNAIRAFKKKGAIAYITKPIDKEELLGEIRTLGLI